MRRMLLTILLALFTSSAFAETNQTDTFTINTYYPSPRGIYRTLEARTSFAVGDVHNDPKIGSMTNLNNGQLYVGNSIVLKSQTNDPPTGKAGQIIYNSTGKLIKFYNGTAWVNATGYPLGTCKTGETCRPNTTWIYCVAPNTCNNPSAVGPGHYAGIAYYVLNCPVSGGNCWLNGGSGPASCPSGQHAATDITGACSSGHFTSCQHYMVCVYD